MSLPPISADATLNNAPFRKALGEMQRDLLSLLDVSKRLSTIKITADLSSGKDPQKMTRALRDAVNEMVPTDMQRRIDTMFAGFDVGVNSAARSAQMFEAQAVALRAKIDELDRAVKITRADFQAGFGEASPQEIAQLTQEMGRLQRELEEVGQEAVQAFGTYSREAQKVANANRLATTTAAAARGEISRLGLASQVKLGAGAALQEYGPQAMGAATGLTQFALASDKARIAQGLFTKAVEKSGQSSDDAEKIVAKLMDTLQVSRSDAEEGIRGLLRQGYTLEQAYTALEGAGASALSFGRNAADGISAFVDASTSMSSAALNNIGISENLSTFYQRYAKELGKTTDELTKQEKAEAELRLIRAATADEVGDLTSLLGGMAGQASSASRELGEAQKELGEVLVPIATNGIRTLTQFLGVFNELPDSVKTGIAILGASAVAIGILAAPVMSVVNGVKMLTTGLVATQTAATGAATAETVLTSATARFNVVTTIKRVLLMDVGAAYAIANRQAMLYSGSMVASATMTNTLSASVATLGTTLKATAAAISVYTVAATAALALGLYWNEQVKQTTKIYEDIDKSNEESFNRTMKRVEELRKQGTDLGRAQAKYLLITDALGRAEMGTPTGKINWITGEREIKRDEQAIARLRAEQEKARQSMVYYYTEAQRRGQLNVKLTDDQTKAVQELNKALEGRRYDLKLEGMTELGADLARLRKEFDTLREDFKKPFTVKGKLMDPAQTPALRDGLSQLDTQFAAEQAQVRKKYADEAVKTARESALAVQRAEIEAMKEGQAKRHAERQLEIEEIRREAKEKAASLSDFPKQAAQVEADARRLIAAKRQGWAQEDEQLERESSKRIRDAQVAARDARISAMADGYAKEEALRRAALDDLRRSIDEQIKLEADPRVRRTLRAEGNAQIAALQRQQERERAESIRAANQQVVTAQVAARDAAIAALQDGRVKEEAVRRAALDDLRQSIAEKVRLLAGDPTRQAQVRSAGEQQVAALERQQQRERLQEIQDGQKEVEEATRRGRDAQIAAMAEGAAKEEAQRRAELADLRADYAERIRLETRPEVRAALRKEAGQAEAAKIREQARERAAAVREGQRDVLEAGRRGRDAEIAAMADGALKAEAQRQAELEDLRRDYAERIRLEKRPEVRVALLKEASQAEAAKIREQARQRLEEQRQAQEQITSMERRTRDATVAAMRDGVVKEEAVRAAALADLRADLKKQVDALEGSPQQQAQVMAEGNRLITATIAQHAEERRRAYEDAQRVVDGVTRAARDASVSAMQDSYEKEVLVRENALDDLVADLNRQANEFKGSETQRQEFIRQANRQVLGLYQQQQRELREIQRAATQQVGEAERSARAAEIAGIRDETAKKQAARNEELRDLHRQTTETLRTLKGSAQQVQAIRDAARREQQAKQATWNLEDEREARAAALRIARAWQEVSNKQFAAQQAARTATQAKTELNLSRRIAAVSGMNDDPVERARLEAEAARQRAVFNQQMADKQLAQDRVNLARARDQALAAENLSAQDRKLIWATYYADLAKLGADYQAGNTQRLQQQEEAERQAAENMRQARIRAAEKPIEQSQGRQGELERSRALATSDAELLAINTRISQERQTQLAALQAQLDGASGVILSTEEREKVEARVRSIQHDQAVSLKEQEQLQRDVAASTLSRADAEAQLAEKLARTEADRIAAQQRQLAVAQLRKAELDRQILAEGREKERNALIEQRFGLLGQIADLQDRINDAPLEAEQRRLELYKAQAAAQLTLQGLGNDEVAQAQLTVQIAAQELLLANQRVAAAQTELQLQQALKAQAEARVGLFQALQQQQVASGNVEGERLSGAAAIAANQAAVLRKLLADDAKRDQRQAEARAHELELLDIAQARAQAEAQITGAAEDGVRSAELELDHVRERLALLDQQGRDFIWTETDSRAAADLLKEQIGLLAQQAEAERKLTEARRQKRDLTEQLTDAERRLMVTLGSPELDRESRATLQLTEAREGLARAERNYLEVREQYRKTGSTADAEKLKAATDALTGSIRAQREAVQQLADTYVGVQDAAARIRAATGGEGAFDVNLERRRLDAINSRRLAAQKALREALAGGDAAQIREAADALAQQEERWKKQADLMTSKGFHVSDVASNESRRLARVLDELGIQRESEVDALQERAAIAEQEALTAIRVQEAMKSFDKTTEKLVEGLSQRYEKQRDSVRAARQDVLSRQSWEDSAEWLDEVASQLQKGASAIAKAAAKPTPRTAAELDRVAATLAQPVQEAVATLKPPAPTPAPSQWLLDYVKNLSSPQVISQAVAQATGDTLSHLARMNVAYTPLDTPATAPATHTVNYYIEIGDTHITANGPNDIRRQLDGWWEGKMRDLKQKRAWEPKRC